MFIIRISINSTPEEVIRIDSITLKANAKINLTLDIKKRRPDGYHEIESVMQSVGLSDTVRIGREEKITVGCTDVRLCGEENLAHRAAALFFKAAGINGGAKIEIEKRIPVTAGLAGGSADAAAVIVGLDALFDTRLGTDRLCEIGVSAGADVPFCIMGGTMIARGIGEKLTASPPLPRCYIVIAKQGEKSSTGSLYAQFDKTGAKKRPDITAMLKALEEGSLKAVGENLCNVFDGLAGQETSPQSLMLKRNILGSGALGASLSGSGPSVFGIFSSKTAAENCAGLIGSSAHICQPENYGCKIIK